MKITREIRQALIHCINEKNITVRDFSHSLGLSHTTVGRWLSGQSSGISCSNWTKIKPLIENYIPAKSESGSERSHVLEDYFLSLSTTDRVDFVKQALQKVQDQDLKEKIIDLLKA